MEEDVGNFYILDVNRKSSCNL